MVWGYQNRCPAYRARRAEAGPFSSLSVFDRLVYENYEPLATLAAVAGATQRIRLLTSVLLMPLRNPVLVAKMGASIDALSNGRLSLGVGIGDRAEDFQAVGVPSQQRARIFEEQLSLIKRVWSGQQLDEHMGAMGPPVVSPNGPEILIGGYSHKAVRRVGKWGDGYIAGISSPAEALDLYREAEASWKAAGRAGKPRFVGAFCFALGPKALERADRYLKDYFGEEGLGLPIPATPKEVRHTLETYFEVGMDEVLLWPCIPDLDQVDRAAAVVSDLLSRHAS
ncbi:LLM class flavin-dependent oxidoreductase [Ktedonosporobacter rubrisoli]|uniref:LLM class flavin-dependent oxidoreductase n=1 Tax=Ktedonosporobacter rubrisoli TaxID=2509675 RepID=A0A4P6JLC7_KTERU|nr:LLM class flavin-dependent oxidoreductase [Ktedonosporobacter rubrisoli]QBD76008.1 LLM class flavin-dependent oxidoreductase [Ktedonosporobacter rubrisoli]